MLFEHRFFPGGRLTSVLRKHPTNLTAFSPPAAHIGAQRAPYDYDSSGYSVIAKKLFGPQIRSNQRNPQGWSAFRFRFALPGHLPGETNPQVRPSATGRKTQTS